MKFKSYCMKKTLALMLSTFLACIAFSQSDSETFTLTNITMIGLKDYETYRAIEVSGLKIGQKVNLQNIKAASGRMAQSGFFKSVRYKYRYNHGNMDLEFQVEEGGNLLPCFYDNFVWFNKEELIEAVRTRVPLFTGLLPQSGTAEQEAIKALQELLHSKKIPGIVICMINADLKTKKPLGFLLKISEIDMPIRQVQFEGVTAISEDVLQENVMPLLMDQYSKNHVKEFSKHVLAPLFREKGYLRVQFKEPEARIQTGSVSENAVSVMLQVNENMAYTWQKPLWTGNFHFPPEHLNRLMGINTGDIANGTKIEEGLESIQSELGTKGYIKVQIKDAPEFNEASGTVRFHFQVETGPQYKMGVVTFIGIPEDMAMRLESKWKMLPGNVFDSSYLRKFLQKDVRNEIAIIRPKQWTSKTVLVPEKLIVNITIEFQR